MPDPTDVRVIAAYATKTSERKATRSRAVYETEAGLIGLAEGRLDTGEAGRPLFPPLDLATLRAIAERAIAGDDAVITNPKSILVLATALVAVLETLCTGETS